MTLGYSADLIARAATAFGLRVADELPWQAPGSPNRTLFRCVITDGERAHILEQVAAETAQRKQAIATAVERLHRAGLTAALPFLPTVTGEHVARLGETYWMAERYVPSDPLPRPGWISETPRGQALAEFLLQLRQVTRGWRWADKDVFRLELWLSALVTQLRRRDPQVLERVRAPLRLAQKVLLAETHLPVAWAHGDLHPLNALWRGASVEAIIDWEFTGPKAELYDLANLIGCAGIEQPAALTGPFVLALVQWLRAEYLTPDSWRALPAYVLALRFAWLAEWLRTGDHEMVALECDYLDLLLEQQDLLAAAWGAC